jgi:AraC-like DNA-binding protein
MPSSAVRTFSEPDDYAAAIRAGAVEVIVTGRGQFAAKQVRIDFHHLWMQRVSDNLPRVWHAANMPGRAGILFYTQRGPRLVYSGVEIQADQIVRPSEGEQYYQVSSGPACFGAMSLPVEEMESLGAIETGLMPPRRISTVTPPPGAMEKLRRLHAAAGRMAENAPEIIANPDAAYGLEQALLGAMVNCFGNGEVREDTVAQRQHELIMRRFRRVLEENPGEPLYIPEICKAIRVAGRTLWTCCQEHLGMGPKRYLLLRRLNLARQALRKADPKATTVTKIATEYGFWQLGRFAGEYQSLFGESPSTTLRGQSG